MAKLSQALDLDEIAFGLPNRIHQSTASQLTKARVALYVPGPTEQLRTERA